MANNFYANAVSIGSGPYHWWRMDAANVAIQTDAGYVANANAAEFNGQNIFSSPTGTIISQQAGPLQSDTYTYSAYFKHALIRRKTNFNSNDFHGSTSNGTMAWFVKANSVTNHTLFGSHPDNGAFKVWLLGDGNIFFQCIQGSSATSQTTTGLANRVDDGNWHFIVIACDGTNNNKIYVDGGLATTTFSGNTLNGRKPWIGDVTALAGGGTFAIANDSRHNDTGDTLNDAPFDGNFAELMFWEGALTAGQVLQLWNASQPLANLSGTVFNDANTDGLFNGSEVGIAGATVYLTGDQSGNTTTAANGYYVFAVPAGTYTVGCPPPSGYTNTSANSIASITVANTIDHKANNNFGERLLVGTISGHVYNDANNNGTFDAGESGINSISVFLTGTASASTTTAANGFFSFTVIPGTYTVGAALNTGYVNTTPNSISSIVISGDGATNTTNDFGEILITGTISGTVYNDVNENGTNDSETGMSDVGVFITGASSTSMNTLSNGYYTFTLTPGTYNISAALFTGYVNTTNSAKSSVIVPNTLGSAQTFNVGEVLITGTISGTVFNDTNNNHTFDTGSESGIGSVVIDYNGLGGSGSVATAANGYYSFTVPPGSYTVECENPAFYTNTTANSINVVLPNTIHASNTSKNFGQILITGVISGHVFNDEDENGSFGTENGIVTTVVLSNGSVSTNTTSASNGYFAFSVTPDTYSVTPNLITGYVNTNHSTVTGIVIANTLGSANTNNEFGQVLITGDISGYVFEDLNNNGTKDGESGLANVQVFLAGPLSTSEYTDAFGFYHFVVTPGTYSVGAALAPGYTNTTANSITGIVVANSNHYNITNQNFGEILITGTISGKVYNDTNKNGIYESEAGISSVEVYLTGSSSANTTTNSTGYFTFTVTPGTYTVGTALAAGYVNTSANSIGSIVIANTVGAGNNDINFGQVLITGTLSGTIFNDVDMDGIKDGGEGGLSGSLVTVTGPTNTSNTTGAGGAFTFTVVPGTYTVGASLVGGYTNTTANSITGIVVANTLDYAVTGINFGEVLIQGTINGYVFDDVNQNGAFGGGESGLAGITVFLSGSSTANTTTDANGAYSFTVFPNTYTVGVGPLSGYVNTTANSISSITVANVVNYSVNSMNFGKILITGNISGHVFDDANNDGIFNISESGLTGAFVRIAGPSSNGVNSLANGYFLFTHVLPGSYTVSVDNYPGYVNSTANSISGVTIANTLGASNTSMEFGFNQIAGVLSGYVYSDTNVNGVKDISESGVANVTVTLSGASSNTTTTDTNGFYSFNIPGGTYNVDVTVPSGYANTTANSITGIVVAGYDVEGNNNFGILLIQGSISGYAFSDVNSNGVLDGEDGIPGVAIALTGSANASTSTDINGRYSFTVVPGTYSVTQTVPSGYVATTPNTISGIVISGFGSSTLNNFGDHLVTGNVSGYVFADDNENGLFDNTEIGISGVTISLTGDSSNTTTTNANGFYTFELVPGTYTVTESQPSGYTSTTSDVISGIVVAGNDNQSNNNFGDLAVPTYTGNYLAKYTNPYANGDIVIYYVDYVQTNSKEISNNFVPVANNTLPNNYYIVYWRSNTNVTPIGGLTPNNVYYIIDSNTSGFRLSSNVGGSAITITPASGIANTIQIVDGGAGYDSTVNNSLVFTGGNTYVIGAGSEYPVATFANDVNGVITSVTITGRGEGYESHPAVSINSDAANSATSEAMLIATVDKGAGHLILTRTPIPGLVHLGSYYVVNTTPKYIKLSNTLGGSPIDFSDAVLDEHGHYVRKVTEG